MQLLARDHPISPIGKDPIGIPLSRKNVEKVDEMKSFYRGYPCEPWLIATKLTQAHDGCPDIPHTFIDATKEPSFSQHSG